ncbi:MAG: ATP phosphoribosyltransferase regulatory subunit [Pseudomonadota bacterium]
MTEVKAGLLPQGFYDELPPHAAHESRLIRHFARHFAAYGYDAVNPPLAEFADTLAFGLPSLAAADMLRIADPRSQQMMAIRSDMTGQVARIATSRLAAAPRPLRLAYAGTILKAHASELRPARQLRQAGVELIGNSGVAATAEVVDLALGGLAALDVAGVTVDFSLPGFAGLWAEAHDWSAQTQQALARVLDAKDSAGVGQFPEGSQAALRTIIASAGPIDHARKMIETLELPGTVLARWHVIVHVAERLAELRPDVEITIDLGESRDFSYQTDVAFSFYARASAVRLGRGGAYRIGGNGERRGEPAVGFTLYLDGVSEAAPMREPAPRIWLPFGTSPQQAETLRETGWVTLSALAEDETALDARRQGCTHILDSGVPTPLDD